MPPDPAPVRKDFEGVVAYLIKRGIIPASSQPSGLLSNARRVHRATYSLILWRFRLTGLSDTGRPFIEELASDALQILPQMLMGYEKTTKLLTRGIIENTLRHIYFSDHPIEFARMNRDQKWYLSTDSLFDYMKIHPAFLDTEPRYDGINRLSSLYSELSTGIHGRTVNDFEMRIALNKITYANNAAKKAAEQLDKCAQAATFLLAVFHRDQVRAFRTEDRQIVLRTMVPKAREVWSDIP